MTQNIQFAIHINYEHINDLACDLDNILSRISNWKRMSRISELMIYLTKDIPPIDCMSRMS